MDALAAVLPAHRRGAVTYGAILLAAAPSANEVRGSLDTLAQRRTDIVHRGADLVLNWRGRFRKGTLPFRLVRLGGESNTLLRWRCAGAGWLPRGGRVELPELQDILVPLPDAVRGRIWEFERRRIEINHEYALVTYAHARLVDLERHRAALAQLRLLGAARNFDNARRL